MCSFFYGKGAIGVDYCNSINDMWRIVFPNIIATEVKGAVSISGFVKYGILTKGDKLNVLKITIGGKFYGVGYNKRKVRVARIDRYVCINPHGIFGSYF